MRALGTALQPVLGLTNSLLTPLKPAEQPVRLPAAEAAEPIPATSEDKLRACVNRLDDNKYAWATLPPDSKAALLRKCLVTTLEVAETAARVSTSVKGSYSNGIGEEHLAWVPLVSGLREYAEALEAGGRPPVVRRTLPTGQHVVDVFPTGLEALLYGGWSGEVWVQKGHKASQGYEVTQAVKALLAPKARMARRITKGSVALVLGAGNQVSVAPLDILHKLVVENVVVVCKMNPVNEYNGPFLRRALAPLVDAGFLDFVYGGAEEGNFLAELPLVKSILLTGSRATYDAIVWGDWGKETGFKACSKRVSGELGCVTPYIITPGGSWSEADLDYHATQVVTGLVHNAGHNCTKVEVVVTSAEWPQRPQFLQALREKLNKARPRVPYYPGSNAKLAAFSKAFPDAKVLGKSAHQGGEPWRFKAGLSASEARVEEENWCGVLQEVALTGDDMGNPSTFLPAAVAFANERCYGNLSCSLFVHPEAEAANKQAVSAAVADLRYGCVAINVVSMMGFCITKLPWGAFPGNPPEDIQSGNCATHNTMLIDHPEKGVLRAPWTFRPTPFWSPFCRSGELVAPRAMKMMAFPTVLNMIPLTIAALLG